MEFAQSLVNGLSLGALYALIAVGYTVVYGIIQLINFAHGEIFMIGAFASMGTWWLFGSPETSPWWLLPIMIVGGVIGAVAVAVLMEWLAYRPLRGAPRLAPLITAIGVSVMLQELVRNLVSSSALPYPRIEGISGAGTVIGGVLVQHANVFTLAALAVCSAGLWWFINKTAMGRAMQATAQDPDTARLMGVNVDRVIMVAFAVGAALAAVAGVAHGLRYNNIDFYMGFMAGLKAFTAAVLGGIGNVWGAVVGGLVLGLVEVLMTDYGSNFLGQFGGSPWKDIWAFALLILVLVFRPQGLLGSRVVDRA